MCDHESPSKELAAEIARGLADVAKGRIVDLDVERIIARGRKLLADRIALAKRGKGQSQ
jgi:predicted transcriptional regulator